MRGKAIAFPRIFFEKGTLSRFCPAAQPDGMWDYAAALCPFPQKSAVDQQDGHAPGEGKPWYSMGKLGLAMKNRAHLPPAVQKFMEYLPFRETAE